MPIPDPASDLDALYYYAKVVEHGGFAAAGRALDIPKSRLSRHVDALERRLGVRLLQRSTRRFVVTDLGREMYGHAQAMLAQAEAAFEVVESASAQPRGLLRVACPVAVASTMLAPVLPRFLAAHPQVRLALEVDNRRVDVLGEGFDVALRVRTVPSGEDGLVMRRFADLHEVLVASPGWLDQAGRPAHPRELQDLPTLSFIPAPERQVWHLRHVAGEEAEVALRPRLRCHQFDVVLAAAQAGLGVALLPRSVAAEGFASGRLEQVLPEWSLPQGVFHAVFPHRRGLLPAVRAFIDFLAETMPAAAQSQPDSRCPDT
ncbi:MAG: LysR substrate-binding domain-containing protein [Pseudoxanthomonas sp.]|nr:LysR substrate-binding domain-containing protein [Pseudoxanthomonas sp.]